MTSGWSDELFNSAALGELRGKFGKQADMIAAGILAEFGPDTSRTVVDEVLRFREWLRGYSFAAEIAPAEKLTIGVTAPIGGGAVLIQLQADLTFLADDGSIREAKPIEIVMTASSLLGQCMDVYKAVRQSGASQDAPPAQHSTQPSTNGQNGNTPGERVEVTTLVISNEKGQKRFKVKGGGYQKFGLSVYPERLLEGWDALDYGEWQIGPLWCRTDGKKVVAWE
jgi:hypothetical protein